MFTGIVEQVGQVVSLADGRLQLQATGHDWLLGESIAVNGCCLTLISSEPNLAFDLSDETLRRTSLGALKQGSLVNLERAMPATGRFGGHFVSGHVDALGEVVGIVPQELGTRMRFAAPEEYARYLVDKGSVAVDGVSLTVVQPLGAHFDVWLIPHTLENTNLRAARVGSKVNLEFDMIAKYVERLVATQSTLDALLGRVSPESSHSEFDWRGSADQEA